MIIDDNFIISEYWPNKISIYKRKKSVPEDVQTYLRNRFYDSSGIDETLYRIKYRIDERPKCQYCEGYVKFTSKGFNRFCCPSCSVNGSKDKIKKTIRDKYGCLPILKPEVLQKAIENSHTKESRDKASNTYKSHGHKPVPINWTPELLEKRKQTCLDRYGIEHTLLIDDIHQKGIDTAKSNESITKRTESNKKNLGGYANRKKYKKTVEDRYGVTHYSMTAIYKEKMSEVMSDPIMQFRRYNTMKSNRTFNSSKPEDASYILLKERFPDTISQYKSDVYPWVCDFYIPSIDTYIECNYHWTHGGHHYDCTNPDDIKKVELWKSRGTKFYDNAIATWTIRDIKKLLWTIEYHLNYKTFYTLNDLKEWIANYHFKDK